MYCDWGGNVILSVAKNLNTSEASTGFFVPEKRDSE